jgi:hypothetical protein
MKYVFIFLMLASPAYASDAKISFALALESMTQTVEKVPRNECKECDGTGKVIAGDTVVIVERDCTACFEPQAQAPAEQTPAQPLYFQVNKIKGCAPCIQLTRTITNLKETGNFEEHDFKIISGGANAYPRVRLIYGDKILYEEHGYHSSKQLADLWNQHNAIITADEHYKEYGPEEWKEFCTLVSLQAYVTGMTYPFHITNHHGEWALRPEQIEGLTNAELIEVHGWQHTKHAD